jgi:threonine/homoserine/homoserine lactone efflux protein
MLPLFTVFFSSFVIGLSGALMPGPLLTATINESSRHGFLSGPLLVLGHGILELMLVAALLAGMAPFLRADWLFITISLTGGAILLWMAYGMFRTLPSLSIARVTGPATEPTITRGEHRRLVWSGILLSLSNPYWTIWWASIGIGYILYCQRFGLWGVAFFFTGHILADLTYYSAVAAMIARGRRFFSDRVYRSVTALCAAFLVLFACYFVYTGVQKITTMM